MNKRILLSLVLCITCTIAKTMDDDTKALIAIRKKCNRIHAAMTIAMMGIDIANSYLCSKEVFAQKVLQRGDWIRLWKDRNEYTPCECPKGERFCQVKIDPYTYTCQPRLLEGLADEFLDFTSHVTTIWRLCSGSVNLYKLYQMEQVLNAQLITEDEKIEETDAPSTTSSFAKASADRSTTSTMPLMSTVTQLATEDGETEETVLPFPLQYTWTSVQYMSAIYLGTITYAASYINALVKCPNNVVNATCYLNNLANCPRAVTIWGLNAVVDALGALNSHENEKAHKKLMLIKSERARLFKENLSYKPSPFENSSK